MFKDNLNIQYYENIGKAFVRNLKESLHNNSGISTLSQYLYVINICFIIFLKYTFLKDENNAIKRHKVKKV